MAKIRTMIANKPYCKHIIDPFFTIDTVNPDAEDFQQVCLAHDDDKEVLHDKSIFRSSN
jgi:hypothetical protein